MHHPTDRIAHTTAFVIPVMEHRLGQDIAQWVHHEGTIRRPIAQRVNAVTTELHLAPYQCMNNIPDRSRTQFCLTMSGFMTWLHTAANRTKDRSDDPSHNERTLLPCRHISLPITPYHCMNNVPDRSRTQFCLTMSGFMTWLHTAANRTNDPIRSA